MTRTPPEIRNLPPTGPWPPNGIVLATHIAGATTTDRSPATILRGLASEITYTVRVNFGDGFRDFAEVVPWNRRPSRIFMIEAAQPGDDVFIRWDPQDGGVPVARFDIREGLDPDIEECLP